MKRRIIRKIKLNSSGIASSGDHFNAIALAKQSLRCVFFAYI